MRRAGNWQAPFTSTSNRTPAEFDSPTTLMFFENDGQQRFTPRILAHAPTHLIVVKAAEMNNEVQPELVTGCFGFYPPFEPAARVTLWERRQK
jgi:hypothetical protein